MRTKLNIGGQQFHVDSIEPYTHVVLVQVNKSPFVPRGKAMKPAEISALPIDERQTVLEELAVFARKETNGTFSLQVGQWARSLEEAQTIADTYRAEREGDVEKYAAVEVHPVSR